MKQPIFVFKFRMKCGQAQVYEIIGQSESFHTKVEINIYFYINASFFMSLLVVIDCHIHYFITDILVMLLM